MDRQQHEYELAASHARGGAEDRHDKRMKEMREIEQGMRDVVRPVSRHAEMHRTAFDVDEDLHFDILNDEEFNY